MWKRLALNYIIRWIILSYHGSKVSGLDSLDCDFEEGICKWSQRQGDDFDWKVGATSTNNTGPDGDHTTGDGYYAYIDTNSEDLENNDNAFLVSPQKTEGTYCFSLWYYMYGKQVVTLNVFQTLTKGRKSIFVTNSSPAQRWILKAINISSTSNFKIIIRGRVNISESRVSGVIAVDDILMLSGNCPSECDDPTPTNGSVDSEIFKLGSVVGITCMSGYTLIGRSSITCLANGTWSGKSECHLIESMKKSVLTAIYVTVPLVVVALIIVVTTIIWRKKIVQFFAVRRSHGQVKKEQPQRKTLFTNMAYSESFNEILPKKGDALSQDDEYADITDDRHETGQSKTTEYSNTVTVIKETEHSYDHMKKSGMSIIDNTYSHITGNKSINTSSNITTESSLSGNASYQSNTRHNIDNCDIRNPKEPRRNLQSNMLDEQESEYDHAQAGGTNPPDTDDYSHLNVGADKSESERYGTRKNLQSNMLDEQESEYDYAQAGGTNPPDTDDYSHLNVGADKSESERYGTRKNLQSNMLDEQESEYDHAQAGGTNPPDTDDYSHLNVGADKSESERYGTRNNLQSNMLDEQESEYDHDQAGGTNPPDTDDYSHLNVGADKSESERYGTRKNLQSNMLDEQESEYDHAQAGGTNPPDTDDYSHLNVGADKSKSECSEIKYFTLDTFNAMYCNVMEQTGRSSIEYDYAYKKPIDESPEYFVLEPKSADTAEDVKD